MAENGEKNPFIVPGSESAFRMGLKKSVFTPAIYKDLPIDYYMPLINSVYESVKILNRTVGGFYKVYPKLYQLHDSGLMFYQDYETVLHSLRKQPQSLWQKVVSQFVKTEKFFKLNQLTQSSMELSSLAAARFLHEFADQVRKELQELADQRKVAAEQDALRKLAQKPLNEILTSLMAMNDQQLQQTLASLGVGNDPKTLQELANAVATAVLNAAKEAAESAMQDVKEFKEAREEAEAAAEMLAGAGGHGYSHEALSVLTFLQNPDEFRRRVRLLKTAFDFMKRFLEITPSSLSQQQVVSMVGGISGVDRMLRESQLKDLLPQELAALASLQDERLKQLLKLDFLLRLSQKQVMVYQRAATLRPVVFVDKSGSMAEGLYDPRIQVSVPKISVAAGLALALYLKYSADIYLFDTEVEGPVSRSRVVDLLLRIRADGGTRIAEVLQKILEIGKKDYIYIVITDGIDNVSSDVIKQLDAAGLKQNVRFILVPPSWEAPWLRNNFKYVYARDVAQFESAAASALR